jgi:DNA adenine methylase
VPPSSSHGKPFLRWAGGKAWLAPAMLAYAHENSAQRVVEPFLGGGAVSLASGLPIVAGDVIPDLIRVWKSVEKNWTKLDEVFQAMPVEKKYFYELREHRPRSDIDRAARFLYLNRACYGGIHRVNGEGKFNVPFAFQYDRNFLPPGRLESAAARLAQCEITEAAYSSTLNRAVEGDFVFVDPPYFDDGETEGGFRRFFTDRFERTDLASCIDACLELRNSATVVVCLGSSSGRAPVEDKTLLAAGWHRLVVKRQGKRLEYIYGSRKPKKAASSALKAIR